MDEPFKSEGFAEIGDYSVFARSISGLETTVVLRKISDRFVLCFDMGIACRENQTCDKVLISHGHMDHISAVPQHVSKRSLFGQKMARYYTPPHLTHKLKRVCEVFHEINETCEPLKNVDVTGIGPGESAELGKGYYVVPFKTVHRIDSQGYILYKRHKRLKEKYRGLQGPEIGDLVKSGVDIHDIITSPEVAYTGDTTFEVFLSKQERSPPPDLFRVKLLIVEATYIDLEDGKDIIQQARDRGHTHLFEIFQNAELFRDIDKILLIHFSDKYSVKYIQSQVYSNMPQLLQEKILISTSAGIERR